jgi:hypothetical protein
VTVPPLTMYCGHHCSVQVSQVTNTSIVFTTVHGWRWSGTRVTVTSDVSRGSFTNVLTPNPIVFQSTNTGQQSASSSSSSSVDVRWVVPVVVVGGLLLLAGLGLVTAAVLRRSRQSKAHQQYQGKDIAAVQVGGMLVLVVSSRTSVACLWWTSTSVFAVGSRAT